MSHQQQVESVQKRSLAAGVRPLPMPAPEGATLPPAMAPEVVSPAAAPGEARQDAPLPPTAAWAAKLPLHLRPHALLRRYAPLADLLALDWDDTDATDEHLTDLLLGRGNRVLRLPQEVRSELLALRVYHESRMRLMPNSWAWRDVD